MKLALLATVAGAITALPTPEQLRVAKLPGLPENLKLEMYSGLLPVSDDHQLFFYYIRSPQDHAKMPLSFWFQGGPGCSSIAGMLTEQGPFWPTENGTSLTENTATWSSLFNQVFVDSPAGVGFSVAKNPYLPTDRLTAAESYILVQQFLNVFPELRSRDIYLTGESYAGHYLPNLAIEIIRQNAFANASFGTDATFAAGVERNEFLKDPVQLVDPLTKLAYPPLKFGGFLVGNPLTTMPYNERGMLDFLDGHGIITVEQHDRAVKACNVSYDPLFTDDVEQRLRTFGPLQNFHSATNGAGLYSLRAADTDACDSAMRPIYDNFEYISIYDVYGDVCVGRPVIPPLTAKKLLTQTLFGRRGVQAAAKATSRLGAGALAEQPPVTACIGYHADDWANRADVQAAIHAPRRKWSTCDDTINERYSVADIYASMVPQYRYILNYLNADPKFRFLVYAGDFDACVPHTSTRVWVTNLHQPEHTPHTVWTHNNQTAGYVRSYNGGRFVYSTVRGSGHMVPSVTPDRALALAARFLDGSLINGN